MSQSIARVRLSVRSAGMPAALLGGYLLFKRFLKGGLCLKKNIILILFLPVTFRSSQVSSKVKIVKLLPVHLLVEGARPAMAERGSHRVTTLFHSIKAWEDTFVSHGAGNNTSDASAEAESVHPMGLRQLLPTVLPPA